MKNTFLNILFLQTIAFTIATASPVNDTNCVNSVSVETNGYRFTICTTNINPKAGENITVKTILKNISTNDVAVVSSVPLLNDAIRVYKDKSDGSEDASMAATNLFDRVDLPSVTTKVHLVPSECEIEFLQNSLASNW